MEAMKWIRKRVAWIAGAATAGMVLWLVGTAVTIQGTQPDRAGLLFGRAVPLDRYVEALQAVTHRAILTHGDRYRQAVPEAVLHAQARERLLLLEEARRRRIRISDGEVVEVLGRMPLFLSEDGRFDRAAYRAVVRYSLGTTPRAFEEEVRDTLKIQELLTQAVGEPEVTEAEIDEAIRKRKEAAEAPPSKRGLTPKGPKGAGSAEPDREAVRAELTRLKQLRAYQAWYKDLLERAKPQWTEFRKPDAPAASEPPPAPEP